MRRIVSLGIALVAIVLAPTTGAAPATGIVEAEGAWSLPAGAALSIDALGIYLSDTAGVLSVSGSAAHARVTRFHTTSADARVVTFAPTTDRSSYDVTNVTLSTAGGPSRGWLGVHADDAIVSTLSAASVLEGAASSARSYGNGVGPTSDDPRPDVRAYSARIDGIHVSVRAAGEISLRGDIAIKFQGLTLDLAADENRSRVRTGDTRADANPLVIEDDWAFIELDDAELRIVTRDAFEIPARTVAASWTGPLRLTAGSGSVRTEAATYVPDGGSAIIDGAFEGEFLPTSSVATRIALAGDLAATTLVVAPGVPSGGAADAGAWGLWAMGIALAAMSGATVLFWRKAGRARAEPLTPEELAQRAGLAAEAAAFDEALRWVDAGLRLAPASARLLTDRGYFLERLGEHQAALDAYAEASRVSPDGEAEFLAYLLSSKMGDHRRAEGWLLLALEKSPSLSLEVDDASSMLSPPARDAVRRARASLR